MGLGGTVTRVLRLGLAGTTDGDALKAAVATGVQDGSGSDVRCAVGTTGAFDL